MAQITAGSGTSGCCCAVSMTSVCVGRWGGGGLMGSARPQAVVFADRYSTARCLGVALGWMELLSACSRIRGQLAVALYVDLVACCVVGCFLVG
jgi:hypothetical protein